MENNYLKPFDRKIDPDQNHTGSGDGADLVVEEAADYSVGEEANHIVSCCIATVESTALLPSLCDLMHASPILRARCRIHTMPRQSKKR
eukprot:COSAG02_NODE_12_length_58022_cov_242.077379_30_plen_89_part_00